MTFRDFGLNDDLLAAIEEMNTDRSPIQQSFRWYWQIVTWCSRKPLREPPLSPSAHAATGQGWQAARW
jgi:hypothetical protein